MKISLHLVILAIIAILSVVVITSTANTVINPTEEDFTEEEMNDLFEAIYDDLSTYVKIDRVIGKYESQGNQRRLSQLAVQIHSLFSKDIDLKDMIIELSNGYDIRYYSYFKTSDSLRNSSLFAHPLFNDVSINSFGLIPMMDKDDSIKNHQMINHHSDRLFIIINLQDSLLIESGESFSLSLHPSVGTIRSLSIDPPFSTRDVVVFL